MARKWLIFPLIVFFGVLAISFLVYPAEKDKPAHLIFQATSCRDCHNCLKPTAKDPCLDPCPRSIKIITTPFPEEGPDVVMLDQLSELYVPVPFAHKLHAQMAQQMGDGCKACHHHSPEGRIPPCRECHHDPSKPRDLRQPGLKGAYHRQCMNCHIEWSHDTSCIFCHARKVAGLLAARPADTTDLVGIKHPRITEPEKKVYKTSYNVGTVVTFHHGQHVKQFGFKCAECHHGQRCTRCHDIEAKSERALLRTKEEHHKPCINCHGQKKCNECHEKTETEGFSHANIGWPLKGYHQSLKCSSCHPNMRRITRLNRDCIACHGNWSPKTFKHTVTGLELDEAHVENDCAECHVDRKFDKKASCANCHPDGREYPRSKPGKIVAAMGR